jgi:predicted phosphodiesterase
VGDDEIANDTQPTRRRTVIRWSAVAVLAITAGTAAISIVSARGGVGPGRVTLEAGWHFDGGTTIAIPPLGHVGFDTHRAPLEIRARIDEIDPLAAEALALDPAAVDRFDASAPGELRSLLLDWTWRALLVALVAGAVAGALVWPRRVLPPLVGAGGAFAAVLVLVAATWIGFSRTALRDPEYHGALTRAPEVLAAVDRAWGGLERVPGRLRALARNITDLTAAVGSGSPGTATAAADEVRILHISDVHSNPVGLELVRGLVRGFDIDAVVDTGDLTSFGLPVEANIGNVIAQIPVPYYFVPGNHDNSANRAALDAFPNVTLLDGDVAQIGDVRLLGFADPAITANGEDTDEEANAKRDAQAPRIGARVVTLRPDVLAVATPRQATDSIGEVPLVITGNSHRRSERVERGTRILTVGSTGATGIGSFTLRSDLPYEAQILRFRRGQLVTIDYVVFEGVQGDYTVSRTVLTPPTTRLPTSQTRHVTGS